MKIVLFALLLPITNCFSFEIDTESDYKKMMHYLQVKKAAPIKQINESRPVRSKKSDKKAAFTDLEDQYFDSISTKASGVERTRSRSK
jgi:hypothetical protein